MTIYTFTNLHNYLFTLTYVLHSFHLINMTRRTLTFCFKYLFTVLEFGCSFTFLSLPTLFNRSLKRMPTHFLACKYLSNSSFSVCQHFSKLANTYLKDSLGMPTHFYTCPTFLTAPSGNANTFLSLTTLFKQLLQRMPTHF